MAAKDVRVAPMDQVQVTGHRVAYGRLFRGGGVPGPPLVGLHGRPLDSREWRRPLDAATGTSLETFAAADLSGMLAEIDVPEATVIRGGSWPVGGRS